MTMNKIQKQMSKLKYRLWYFRMASGMGFGDGVKKFCNAHADSIQKRVEKDENIARMNGDWRVLK